MFIPKDRRFVFKTKRFKFPEIKELKILNMDEESDDTNPKSVNYFLKHSFNRPIRYLYLNGGEYGKLNKFSAGLNKLLSNVTEEIFIVNFTIDSETLKKVIINCFLR